MVRGVPCFGSITDRLFSRRRGKVVLLLTALFAGLLCYILTDNDGETDTFQRLTRRTRKHWIPAKKLEFPDEYHAKGVLSLPYGDIVEPFEVWYSGPRGMSRIDYYGGMDKTFQRSDLGRYGYACKIVPEYSERTGKTFKGCLHRRGNRKFEIKAQSIVPAPKYFRFAGYEDFRGKPCAKWEHSFNIYNKVNTYTLYTSRNRPYVPVRYEMMGYDTLLSSYYDHYILDYHYFKPWKYQYTTFDIPTDIKCFDFSHQKFVGAVGEINPMMEFMPHIHHQKTSKVATSSIRRRPTLEEDSEKSLEYLLDELNKMPFIKPGEVSKKSFVPHPTVTSSGHSTTLSLQRQATELSQHLQTRITPGTSNAFDIDNSSYEAALQHYEDIVNHLFTVFKVDYQKAYATEQEHERRKDIYRHNMRFINSRNRQHLGYKLKANHMADLTDGEVNKMKGLLREEKTAHSTGSHVFALSYKDRGVGLPEHVDWRKSGAVNSVKSQGICGSCYAFAVAGALESAYFIKTGSKLDLSEQQIVDCTWGFGNRGCKGGYPYRAMQWILKHGGLATERSYGKYLAQEGYCHFKNTSIGVMLDKYMTIAKGNTSELKMAVAFYGPVSILVNTQPKSFKFYGSGIYYDPQCTHALDHAALAVGYGVEKGVPYWIVKNSWSAMWGERGYIKIAMKEDNCGVAQKAVVVDVQAT